MLTKLRKSAGYLTLAVLSLAGAPKAAFALVYVLLAIREELCA